jgi:hypothetical protein
MKQVERRRKSKKGGREAASWELRNLKFQVEKGESKRKVRRGGGEREREREKAKEAREGRERGEGGATEREGGNRGRGEGEGVGREGGRETSEREGR